MQAHLQYTAEDKKQSVKLISCIKGHYIAPSGFELEGLFVAALAVLLTLGYFLTVYLADVSQSTSLQRGSFLG